MSHFGSEEGGRGRGQNCKQFCILVVLRMLHASTLHFSMKRERFFAQADSNS